MAGTLVGTPELMDRHQHAPSPLEELQRIPPSVIVLLKSLLEKDSARRFQNPTELLKVSPRDWIGSGNRDSIETRAD
ncbi:MAG: hypothetical protein JO334_03980 [Verrucomicrobia bacterium]|nr:hypothetical protein [Verrucomicrobiota bacterium]